MSPIQVLKSTFGFTEFRGHQEAVINEALAGHSALVVMPTGMGKSLCYQLPSCLLEGLTLVVSPLIALMDDQVRQARAKGLAADAIHSGMSAGERDRALLRVETNQTKLLYVTPERFRKIEFQSALKKVKVSLFAVDEAHCISQWGHDFRPDYTRLNEYRRQLGNPPLLALTATATGLVQKDILENFGEWQRAKVFVDGVERRNLFLSVLDVYGLEEKIRWLVRLRHEHPGPAIFYFALISTLEKVSEQLSRAGLPHLRYHGQLDDQMRRQSQLRFMKGEGDLILATPAFGLGVDKPDVRLLVHVELPGSPEAYYQEVGRAGRDGQASYCHLLYDPDDVSIQMDFIKWANPEPEFTSALYRLLKENPDRVRAEGLDYLRGQLNFYNRRDFRLETALNLMERWDCLTWPNHDLRRLQVTAEIPADYLSREQHQARLRSQNQKLLDLVQWIGLQSCRRIFVHQYFGVEDNRPCGFCDNCQKDNS